MKKVLIYWTPFAKSKNRIPAGSAARTCPDPQGEHNRFRHFCRLEFSGSRVLSDRHSLSVDSGPVAKAHAARVPSL